MRVIKIYIFLLSLFVLSCTDDLPQAGNQSPEKGMISVMITIPCADGAVTRGNPESGEDGNGREQGMLNENAVHDINLFFYEGKGLNPGDAENIDVRHVYIPEINPSQVTDENLPFEKKITVAIDNAESILGAGYESRTISFVTVINAGYLTGISKLGDLRQYTGLPHTWENGTDGKTGSEDYFVMSTAYDAPSGSVPVGNGTKVGSSILYEEVDDPKKLKGETTVERMCARLDLMFDNELVSDGVELVYTVTGMEGSDLPKVHITNILPVNCMQKPSFLIRKVTESIPESWTENGLGKIIWGGMEKQDALSAPANYVIEPKTLDKEKKQDDSVLSEWYGETRASQVKKDISDSEKGKVSSYYSKSQNETLNGHSYTNLLLIGYTNENVQSPAQYNSDYLTGMVFRGVYQPSAVYGYATGKNMKKVEAKDFKGDKIYQYSPSSHYDGKEVEESRCIYFEGKEDAEAYKRDNAAENGVINEFSGANVYGSEDDAYIGFDCYYNLWLRHYNDISDPHEALPMEYATVRNNIYRVAVEFTGPGDPSPLLREPNHIKARIFARNWKFLLQPEINM